MIHWFQYNFAPHAELWYRGAIWPNVFVILVVAPLTFLWLRGKHLAILAAHDSLKAAHVEHAEKLDRLLNKLDPDTEGGIATVLDRLDENTPHGVGAIHEKLKALEMRLDMNQHDVNKNTRAVKEHSEHLKQLSRPRHVD